MKTIFLDRDGVINNEISYLHKIDEFVFIEGIFKACQNFKNLGYQIIIVTNQSGISRGYFSEEDFHTITDWMLIQFEINGVNILDVFHCPHSPKANCSCRKPKPGMFIQAKKKHKINMDESWMIGDSERDIKAANLAGIKNTIIVKSGHKVEEDKSLAMFVLDSIINANQVIIN
jgi:D-glycero-D-manno-heptose 1,7-bisphosphate phosphatase